MPRCYNYADVLSRYIKAGCPELDEQELRMFANSDVARIRLRVAENIRTPRDILEQLARDVDPDVRIAVASNTNATIDLVRSLAKDEEPSVRLAIAEDPRTPTSILKELAEDSNAYVSVRACKTLEKLRRRKFARSIGDCTVIRMLKHALGNGPNDLQYA